MFYVVFMKPVSHLKNLSRYNYALWWNISTDTGGHFQFRDFQLNKIIGFSLSELYEETFISLSLQTYIYPPKFYTLPNNMQ